MDGPEIGVLIGGATDEHNEVSDIKEGGANLDRDKTRGLNIGGT